MQALDSINAVLDFKQQHGMHLNAIHQIEKLSQNFSWKGKVKDLRRYFRSNKIKLKKTVDNYYL